MRPPLVIEGTLDEVESTLLKIKNIIDNRKTVGWPLFQRGEKWLYITRPDLGSVCPICMSYEGVVFDGEKVPSTFPYKEVVAPYTVKPRTHMPNLEDFMNEPCHCEMILQNPAEVMEMRMHEEKLAVI